MAGGRPGEGSSMAGVEPGECLKNCGGLLGEDREKAGGGAVESPGRILGMRTEGRQEDGDRGGNKA